MSALYKTGVTVGKFSPPHLGHAYLITSAAHQVETLYILVCHKQGQINADKRVAWLREVTPRNCKYLITADDLPEAPEPWAARAMSLIDEPVDVAFSSEIYGDAWATYMDADHVCIDLYRHTVPVSATVIRANPIEQFSFLVPAARAALCKRFVLAGAESSGKTTLAKTLAAALATVWVPEYGRLYCDGRGLEADWDVFEFAHIASMQTQMIDAMARQANHGALIVDTDALVTRIWQRRYLPNSKLIDLSCMADHYFVCEPVAWKQDGTRESDKHQDAMFSDTLGTLDSLQASYTILSGTHEARLAQAIGVVRERLTLAL